MPWDIDEDANESQELICIFEMFKSKLLIEVNVELDKWLQEGKENGDHVINEHASNRVTVEDMRDAGFQDLIVYEDYY